MNMGADFSTAIGGAGILSSPNPELGAFDLNDLEYVQPSLETYPLAADPHLLANTISQ